MSQRWCLESHHVHKPPKNIKLKLIKQFDELNNWFKLSLNLYDISYVESTVYFTN